MSRSKCLEIERSLSRKNRISADALRNFDPDLSCLDPHQQTFEFADLLALDDARWRHPDGGIIGATDKRGEDVIERACGPGDFLSTIYHHLGIDAAKVTINDFNGRPTHLVNDGRPIPELMGRTA